MSNHLRLASIVFLTGAAAACGGDDGGTATTSSHLTGRASANAAVEAEAVDASGGTTAIADTTAGADGRYTIDVALPDGAVALVLRTADAAVVMSDAELAFAGDATLAAPPLDAAATVTTDVYLRALATADGALELETLALVLSPGVTARIEAAVDHDAAVNAAASAAIEAGAAWSLALDGVGSGASAAAANAMVEAEVAAAAALDRGGEVEAGYAMYVQATVTGVRTAGYDAARIALAADAAAQAMIDGGAAASSAQLGALVAIATAASVDARVATIADGDWSAVISAGATLRATATATADTGAVIEAFAAYQAAVSAAIAAHGQLTADVVVQVTTDIDAAAATLETQLAAAASATAIVDAFVAYRAAITSEAHVALLVGAGVSEASARASLAVLADVEAATH